MFGNMRLAAGGATKALLVPDAAVQTDQARKIVMVVAADGSVAPRPVVLGPLVDGLRVIRSGLDRHRPGGDQRRPDGDAGNQGQGEAGRDPRLAPHRRAQAAPVSPSGRSDLRRPLIRPPFALT